MLNLREVIHVKRGYMNCTGSGLVHSGTIDLAKLKIASLSYKFFPLASVQCYVTEGRLIDVFPD